MILDYDESIIKTFDIYNAPIEVRGKIKTRNFNNLPVSDWEINIYKVIRTYTKYYNYPLIARLLNDNEIPTFKGTIGGWTIDVAQSIVRRVENHLNIESRERLDVAIRSFEYRNVIRSLVAYMKSKNPDISWGVITEQINIHNYPRHNPDDSGKWTTEALKLLMKKRY